MGKIDKTIWEHDVCFNLTFIVDDITKLSVKYDGETFYNAAFSMMVKRNENIVSKDSTEINEKGEIDGKQILPLNSKALDFYNSWRNYDHVSLHRIGFIQLKKEMEALFGNYKWSGIVVDNRTTYVY